MARVLIIGGYGAFGSRAAGLLARDEGLEIIVAGRDGARAEAQAAVLARTAKAKIRHARMDARLTTAADLKALAPRVVVNASGPYQSHDYTLAKACIGAGCHYIDLADARGFVMGITALDGAAKAAGVLVVSGASSVPGLSSAVVQAHAGAFKELKRLDIAISPGNSFDPGQATVASVLGGIGKPIRTLVGGAWRTVYGWQGLSRYAFPELGGRWMGYVDVPDLDLFPAHYPCLETVRVRAGLEVGLFHFGLWGLSWLVRSRLIAKPERLAGSLLAAKRRLSVLGGDRGAMLVTLEGRDWQGREKRLDWHLIAGSGHGPYVPAIPSVILARRLARGVNETTGAMPCFGLFTPDELAAETTTLDIRCVCA